MKLGLVLGVAVALCGLASPADAAVRGDVAYSRSERRTSRLPAGTRPLNLKRLQPVGDGFQKGYRGNVASPLSAAKAHRERAVAVAKAGGSPFPSSYEFSSSSSSSSSLSSSSSHRELGNSESGSGDPARDAASFMQFPLFGGIESLGYYYTFVSVGEPNAQPFTLILVRGLALSLLLSPPLSVSLSVSLSIYLSVYLSLSLSLPPLHLPPNLSPPTHTHTPHPTPRRTRAAQ